MPGVRGRGSRAAKPARCRARSRRPPVTARRCRRRARLAPGFYDIITACRGAAGETPRIGRAAIRLRTIASLVPAGTGVARVPQSLRNLRRTGVVGRPLAGHAPLVETGRACARAT
ncbi:hypothetical protein GQ57_23385 [Burkholderia sp. MSh2]|nr:hypothetical protein GQ57_23385 [Burkholderia sp. MSh2]